MGRDEPKAVAREGHEEGKGLMRILRGKVKDRGVTSVKVLGRELGVELAGERL